MLFNYLKIVWRNISRDKSTSTINIAGLVLGITSFLLTFIWVYHQYSFDSFHEKGNQIYRVTSTEVNSSGVDYLAVTPPALGPELKEQLPEIDQVTRVDRNDAVVLRGDNRFNEDNILLVDPDFLSMFDFKLLSGSQATALEDPFSIVLSQEMASKYFSNVNPIGQTIKLFLYDRDGQGVDYTVTGVIENPPANSHIQYTFLASFSTIETTFADILEQRGWLLNNFYTYILTRDDASTPASIEAKIAGITASYFNEAEQGVATSFSLQLLSEIYLHSNLDDDVPFIGDYTYVLIVISIGLFVLFLAVVNYINMTTTKLIDKVKSLVVRKVNGAKKSQLMAQIITETLVYVIISFVLAAFLIEILSPLISPLIGEQAIQTSFLSSIPYGLVIVLLIGIVAGTISGILISKIDIVKGLKGRFILNKSTTYLRKVLVTFQFSITAVLLIGIFFVSDQMDFIKNKALGFSEEQLVVLKVNGSGEVFQNYNAFEQGLLQQAAVENVARSNTSLANGLDRMDVEFESATGQFISATAEELGVDYRYLSTYGIDLSAGRNFNVGLASDSTQAVIINEAAVQAYGWETNEAAIGKRVRFLERESTVIGVVQNFHTNSLHHEVPPVFLFILENAASRITVKMSTSSTDEAISFLQAEWSGYFPNSLFDFAFVDAQVENQYRFEARFTSLFRVFSILSLFIACTGLFGLANFSIKKRTKEIGIRKVLGASISRILAMTVKEFLTLIVIANLVALPIIYLIVQKWLQLFAYKTDISFVNFAIGVLLILVISFSVVIYHSLKAALINPVDSLRSE